MFDAFRNLPPPYDGIPWVLAFLIALLGLVFVARMGFSVVASRRQAARDRAARERLTAIETTLADVVERVGRLEGRADSGANAARPQLPATHVGPDRL